MFNQEKKIETFSSVLSLVNKLIITPRLHTEYFQRYQVLYKSDNSGVSKLIYCETVDSYRDVTELDLMELQVELMMREQIDSKNFSILSQALMNYLHVYNNTHNVEKLYDKSQDTEEEILLDIIYRQYKNNDYVEPKTILAEFGLKPNQFKRYDQKLAKILTNEGFVKSIKKKNNIRFTVYSKVQQVQQV